jgi:hypothetical protein
MDKFVVKKPKLREVEEPLPSNAATVTDGKRIFSSNGASVMAALCNVDVTCDTVIGGKAYTSGDGPVRRWEISFVYDELERSQTWGKQ